MNFREITSVFTGLRTSVLCCWHFRLWQYNKTITLGGVSLLALEVLSTTSSILTAATWHSKHTDNVLRTNSSKNILEKQSITGFNCFSHVGKKKISKSAKSRFSHALASCFKIAGPSLLVLGSLFIFLWENMVQFTLVYLCPNMP